RGGGGRPAGVKRGVCRSRVFSRTCVMRQLWTGMLVLALAVIARGQDATTKDKPAKTGADFKALGKKVQDEAKDKGVKSQAEFKPIVEKYVPEFLAFAEKNPKDDNAINALAVCIQYSGDKFGKDTPAGKALALVIKDHVQGDKIA